MVLEDDKQVADLLAVAFPTLLGLDRCRRGSRAKGRIGHRASSGTARRRWFESANPKSVLPSLAIVEPPTTASPMRL